MSEPIAQILNGRATSIIDRVSSNKSIIDSYTTKLRLILRDPTLDERFVALIVQKLSEKDIHDLADYCARKARNPGHAFVKLCSNVMNYKTLR